MSAPGRKQESGEGTKKAMNKHYEETQEVTKEGTREGTKDVTKEGTREGTKEVTKAGTREGAL